MFSSKTEQFGSKYLSSRWECIGQGGNFVGWEGGVWVRGQIKITKQLRYRMFRNGFKKCVSTDNGAMLADFCLLKREFIGCGGNLAVGLGWGGRGVQVWGSKEPMESYFLVFIVVSKNVFPTKT